MIRALGLAALLALAACTAGAEGVAAPPEGEIWAPAHPDDTGRQRVVEAREREIQGTLEVGARVAFDDQRVAHVFAATSGRVARVLAGPGDRVGKGSPLAALLSPDAGAAFSDLAKAEADLALAQGELARQRRLRAVDAASPRDLEAAEDAFGRADAERARARERAAALRGGPADGPVTQEILLRSPIAGQVMARAASPGVEVAGIYAGGNPVELFTVGDIDRVWVLGEVNETDLPRIRVGARAHLRLVAYPGRTFEGTVDWIANALDPVLRTARLRVTMANPGRLLKPGMYGQLAVDLPPVRALTVPRHALVRIEGQRFVYAAGGPAPDGRVRYRRRRVEAVEEGDLALISAGLAAGDRVLYEGAPTHDVESEPVRISTVQAGSIGLRVETVADTPFAETLAAGAQLAFDDQRVVHVYSPVSGRVVRALAAPGDHVRKGQPLIELVSPEVGSAFADARKARADLVAAEHELARQRELVAAHASAPRDLEVADDTARRARAELERAEAKTRMLSGGTFDAVTERLTLRSPIDGEVVARSANPGLEVQGQWSGAGAPVELITVGALDRLWVQGDVYEMDLPAVRKGQPVVIRVPAFPGRTFSGRVEWVSDVIDPATRTARVRCSVANPDRSLRPDMVPTLAVGGSVRRVVALPRSALLRVSDGVIVFVAEPRQEGGSLAFRPRRVIPAASAGDRVTIAAGLVPGESVVVSGAVFLLGLL